MHYPGYLDEEYQFYDDKGKMIGSLRSKDFEPYYFDLDKPSYVYCRKQIAGSENAYLFDSAESQIVSEDDLIAMLKKGISYLDTEMDGSVPDYYGEAVVAALKAMFAAKDGSMVYMEVD